jgi:molybdopterin/thiamine biosynthesis adenylyltransferase
MTKNSRYMTAKPSCRKSAPKGKRSYLSPSVLCIGAGGLGCPALLYLTAAGVGRIGIVDFDTVDETNLQRQVLFTMDQLGRNKAEAAKKAIKSPES